MSFNLTLTLTPTLTQILPLLHSSSLNSICPKDLRHEHLLSAGIEPATLGLLDPRSNQLSYESISGEYDNKYKFDGIRKGVNCLMGARSPKVLYVVSISTGGIDSVSSTYIYIPHILSTYFNVFLNRH